MSPANPKLLSGWVDAAALGQQWCSWTQAMLRGAAPQLFRLIAPFRDGVFLPTYQIRKKSVQDTCQ